LTFGPWQHTEGIILREIPFQDYDQILTLFTSDAGMIKVLYKGSRSKRRGVQGLCIPLTKVEIVYREKSGEIFGCQEMTLVDSYSLLRKKLLHLNVACDLLQVILASQLVGKTAPQLYTLLSFFLEKIPQTAHPWTLATSFRLKLLRHDGLAPFPFICSECGQLLQTVAYTYASEGWCVKHQPAGCRVWEQSELQHIYRLAVCQSYREICADEISSELQNKVEDFFEACVKR
jgi:DNA repair protein RecO (recombination protein O)